MKLYKCDICGKEINFDKLYYPLSEDINLKIESNNNVLRNEFGTINKINLHFCKICYESEIYNELAKIYHKCKIPCFKN